MRMDQENRDFERTTFDLNQQVGILKKQNLVQKNSSEKELAQFKAMFRQMALSSKQQVMNGQDMTDGKKSGELDC